MAVDACSARRHSRGRLIALSILADTEVPDVARQAWTGAANVPPGEAGATAAAGP